MTAITAEVYGCIRDEDYAKAIDLLQDRLNEFPRSRSLLSLTVFCIYHNGEYSRASELYETLIELCPEVVFIAERIGSGGEDGQLEREQ